MKIDYRGLCALDSVIQTQSFAMAAKQLFITQPAVSQRIKQLENHFGQPLLIRTLPYTATPLGERLLSLLRRTRLLEEHFIQELDFDTPSRLSIALNRDSLETWFMKALPKINTLKMVNIDIITDDQELTIDYLRKGIVSSCLTSYSKPLPGCECELLGHMDYLLVASPDFIKRYFNKYLSLQENMMLAPILVFDSRDRLHEYYFQQFFKTPFNPKRYHMVPSVEGFKQFALQGYGFGLIPRLDILEELEQNKLIEINPGKRWLMPLYWHYWQLSAHQYQTFIQEIAKEAQKYLI